MHRGITTLIILTLSIPNIGNGQWPCWRGPHHNGTAYDSETLAQSWPVNGPPIRWAMYELPSGGSSSPVIADNRVYVYIHNKRVQKDITVCLDANSGEKLWQREMNVDRVTLHDASGTPCVVDGRVYITGARVCYCLASDTGEVIWKADTGVPATDPTINGKRQELSSSFVVVGNTAAVSLGPLFGFNALTGDVLWRSPEAGGYAGAMTSVAPWFDHNMTYLVYSGQDRLCCINAETGRLLWQEKSNGRGKTYATSPAIQGNRLAVCFSQELRGYELSKTGGKLLWSIPYAEEYASPIHDGQRVYTFAPSDRKNLYELVCRDAISGKQRWKRRHRASVYSSPILADGKVFLFVDKARQIAMFDANTGKRLASQAVPGLEWSSPAVANGCLFIRTKNGLICYEISKDACTGPLLKIEGEKLVDIQSERIKFTVQDMREFGRGWSGNKQLFMVPHSSGGMLEINLQVPQYGQYELVLFLTKAPDYGMLTFSVNGKQCDKQFEGYAKRVIPSGPISLGKQTFHLGKNRITIKIHSKATMPTATRAGLDAIELRHIRD